MSVSEWVSGWRVGEWRMHCRPRRNEPTFLFNYTEHRNDNNKQDEFMFHLLWHSFLWCICYTHIYIYDIIVLSFTLYPGYIETKTLSLGLSCNDIDPIAPAVSLEGRRKQCYSYVSPEDMMGVIGLIVSHYFRCNICMQWWMLQSPRIYLTKSSHLPPIISAQVCIMDGALQADRPYLYPNRRLCRGTAYTCSENYHLHAREIQVVENIT